jgi:hypothetical protein
LITWQECPIRIIPAENYWESDEEIDDECRVEIEYTEGDVEQKKYLEI